MPGPRYDKEKVARFRNELRAPAGRQLCRPGAGDPPANMVFAGDLVAIDVDAGGTGQGLGVQLTFAHIIRFALA